LFILGSASPRRRQLLEQIGCVPDVVRLPDIDESPLTGESPRDYCSRMAVEKVNSIASESLDIVLSADTTVALGRRILGKAENAAEAKDLLQALSGRRPRVLTAVAVTCDRIVRKRLVVRQVRMKRLSEQEIRHYLLTDDWCDKAGAYGIQGSAASFIPWISGSFSAVVGLPLAETTALLQSFGYSIWNN